VARERRSPIGAERRRRRGASERPPNPAAGWTKRPDCCRGEGGAAVPDVQARVTGGELADGTELALYLVCRHPCGIRSCFGHVTIWDPAVETSEDGWVYTLDETLGCKSPTQAITFTWRWSEWNGPPADLKGLAVKVDVSVMSCCGLPFVHEWGYDYPETPPGPAPEPPEPPDLGPI
jgi:hypothetical protein